MTTYIKDLIDLPERVHGGDFVLKLTEGVGHPEETLRPSVVTPELARNFDDALDFNKGLCAVKQQQGGIPARKLRLR